MDVNPQFFGRYLTLIYKLLIYTAGLAFQGENESYENAHLVRPSHKPLGLGYLLSIKARS